MKVKFPHTDTKDGMQENGQGADCVCGANCGCEGSGEPKPLVDRKVRHAKDLRGTKTYDNLMTALAGESQAYAKYGIFASVARKDGYRQIGTLFDTTADNEREHAKIWLGYLGQIGSTHDNLIAAAGGEHYEWSEMYRKFAQDAMDEGFEELAGKFLLVGRIEEQHETAYNAFVKQIETDTVYAKADKIVWICSNCGFTAEGEIAPKTCPVCSHPQSFFQEKK